jgi:hypothetical protein
MPLTTARLIFSSLLSAPLAASLYVASGSSPCAKYCGNVQSSTASDEIVCDAISLKTPSGLVWEQCIGCLLTSTHVDKTNKTDLQSLTCTSSALCLDPLGVSAHADSHVLDNLRFNVKQCLFDGDINPCMIGLVVPSSCT